VHYFMPARRSTTNLLQATGELLVGESEEAPLPFAVLAPGAGLGDRAGTNPDWLLPLLRTIAEVGPDDAVFGFLPAVDLPEPSAQAMFGEAVQVFHDALMTAEGILVLVDDDPAGTAVVKRALAWAALPEDESILEALPVVVLGVAGDTDALATTVATIRAAVEAGGGDLIDVTGDTLAGPWDERIEAGGRVGDVPTRQAIGQATLRLRHAVDAWDESGDNDAAETPGLIDQAVRASFGGR
jgi:hypothetical protein